MKCDFVAYRDAGRQYNGGIFSNGDKNMLAQNLGKMDRVIRLVGGAALIALAATGTIGIWGWLGAVFVATAFLNFCPIYRVFGLKTCSEC